MTIKNNIIPFGGCKCINIFGILFTKSDLDEVDENHEGIHSQQILLCILIFAVILAILAITLHFNLLWILAAIPSFYIWYVVEWLIRLCINSKTAYKKIAFEQEAYDNEENLSYKSKFGWFKYYFV